MRIYVARILEGYDEGVISMLDPDRRQKVALLKNEKEKLRCISVGLLLRRAYLERYKDSRRWEDVDISKGQYGKPFIAGQDDFKYSLSHSGDYVLCAVDGEDIGADIQEIKSCRMGTAKRFFHESEYNRVDGEREFYKIWTAKESMVKYSGRGIGAGIEHIVTDVSYTAIKDITKDETYSIRIYDKIEGYMVCVCSKGNNFPVELEMVGGLVC